MVRMFGTKGTPCARCGREGQDAGANYCAACGLVLGAPRGVPALVDNRWAAGPDELAVFFGVRDLSGVFVKTLRVPAASRAYILQGDKATEVPQGEYEIEGFFTRLNHLLRDQHAEILVTRSTALPVEVALEGLRTSEGLEVAGRFTLAVRIENVPAFARHFMTVPGTIRTAELAELLAPPLRQLAGEFVAARSLRDMDGKSEVRAQLDQHLQGGLALLLADYGLAAVRVDTLALRHDRFDAEQRRIGTAWLAAHDRQAQDALYTDAEWQRLRREEQEARLRYRRAELGQEERIDQADLSLKNAERLHLLRAREIELYGRIAESKTRKEALARGAEDAVAELEHTLAAKRGARADEETRWAHVRELAAIRMRAELEVAEQETREARAVARQRFAHGLLQQQIRNKIEQARGIEDAARQRAELARLHQEQQACARREQEIAAEEHAGRLALLRLAHAARRRETERVLEWEDAQAGARVRAVGRTEDVEAEDARQRIEALRRDGAGADAIAQHEKLLRTIAADAELARREQAVALEGEQARAAIALGAEDAARRHELARIAALGGVDDMTKLAVAGTPNAGLLADVMTTRVHAGMSAEQIAALAQLAGAPNVAGSAAADMARQEVERERARQDLLAERERRHQLDVMGLQNDVNKAALASHGQVAGALGAALARPAGAAACAHAHAREGDRYCGACGAALPARD